MKKTLSKGSNSFFTNEETEIHKGRKIPPDTHPISDQNLEFPNPGEVRCLLSNSEDNGECSYISSHTGSAGYAADLKQPEAHGH